MRLLCFTILAAGGLAQAAIPGFLPPETKVVIGVSVRGLIDSPLLAGDPAMVRGAIDRRAGSSSLAPALLERTRALESQYDLWGAGELPQGIPAKAGGTPELQSIDRFQFGAALRHGLEVSAQLHVKSSKDAEKLMQSMKLLEFMVAGQAKKEGGPKFDLQSDHDTLKLALFIPEEDLKKGIEAQKANLAAALTGQTGQASPPAPKPAPTPGSVVKNPNDDAVTVTLPRK